MQLYSFVILRASSKLNNLFCRFGLPCKCLSGSKNFEKSLYKDYILYSLGLIGLKTNHYKKAFFSSFRRDNYNSISCNNGDINPARFIFCS